MVCCWLWFIHDNEKAYGSLLVELAIAIPVLFVYCDWNLCQELYDKKRNLERFSAIGSRLRFFAFHAQLYL